MSNDVVQIVRCQRCVALLEEKHCLLLVLLGGLCGLYILVMLVCFGILNVELDVRPKTWSTCKKSLSWAII